MLVARGSSLSLMTPFGNRDLVNIIRKDFPKYADQLPKEDAKGGDRPDKLFSTDRPSTPCTFSRASLCVRVYQIHIRLG